VSARGDEIVATARRLLDAEGAEALSMRRLADEIGIRAPSLYKHVRDKRELEAALISAGFEEFAERQEEAADDVSLARVYRDFAREHPHLYRLMTSGPLPRERLAPGVEERAAAPVVAAAGGDPDLARALWAFAHGMTILELDGRFPPGADLDAAWRTGLNALLGR
jgi:AcrR family transcriptional regulator